MPVSRNSIPMVGEEGEHDYIDRGLFTIVRVRENLTSYDDPGWYENPPGTLASLASNDESQRDLGVVPSSEKSFGSLHNFCHHYFYRWSKIFRLDLSANWRLSGIWKCIIPSLRCHHSAMKQPC
jgi:hypothetical protein